MACTQVMDVREPVQDSAGVVYEKAAVLGLFQKRGGPNQVRCPLAGVSGLGERRACCLGLGCCMCRENWLSIPCILCLGSNPLPRWSSSPERHSHGWDCQKIIP